MYLERFCNWIIMGRWCLAMEGVLVSRLGGLPGRLVEEKTHQSWEVGRLGEGGVELLANLG